MAVQTLSWHGKRQLSKDVNSCLSPVSKLNLIYGEGDVYASVNKQPAYKNKNSYQKPGSCQCVSQMGKNGIFVLSGAGGNRTRVQTYPPKAFYMLISALGCRNVAGAELTNPVRIRLDFHYTLTETMCTYPSMV